jgi:hypothetical protein
MSLIFTHAGESEMLIRALKVDAGAADPWSIGLYVNDVHPLQTTTFAALVQATFPGYFRQNIDRALWAAPVLDGNRERSDYGGGFFEWVNSGPDTDVWGYFLLNSTSLTLLGAERFPAAVTIPATEKLRVQLRVYSRSEATS